MTILEIPRHIFPRRSTGTVEPVPAFVPNTVYSGVEFDTARAASEYFGDNYPQFPWERRQIEGWGRFMLDAATLTISVGQLDTVNNDNEIVSQEVAAGELIDSQDKTLLIVRRLFAVSLQGYETYTAHVANRRAVVEHMLSSHENLSPHEVMRAVIANVLDAQGVYLLPPGFKKSPIDPSMVEKNMKQASSAQQPPFMPYPRSR